MKENYLSEFEIDLSSVKQHYIKRAKTSNKLVALLQGGNKTGYVELAVGISDPLGNYSANEHQLGPRILESNSVDSVYNLAINMFSEQLKVTHLPKLIYQANLPYLKIGIGSEMGSLLQPNKFWVGNVRTIWSHLVIKHKGDWEKANEELELYRNDDISSEMNYQIWRDIYLSMESSLITIFEISELWANEQEVKLGKKKYIWIDAVCNALYERE